MSEDDVVACLCHLIVAIVEEHLGREREGVGLIHLDMPESIEGIVGLVVACAVARQDDAVVTETYMPSENLGVAILVLVVEEFIGMNKMYA